MFFHKFIFKIFSTFLTVINKQYHKINASFSKDDCEITTSSRLAPDMCNLITEKPKCTDYNKNKKL